MAWKEGSGQGQGYWQVQMKIVVHENQQTIWVTMSSKLFRCAPEHVRPVTAEEAKSILQRPNEPSISEIAQQLPTEVSGILTRYVDLGIPAATSPITPVLPHQSENENNPSNASNEDQPDVEPETPSSASTEKDGSAEMPVVEDPKDIPVPIDDDDDDDDLVCEGLHSIDAEVNALEDVDQDLAWRAEVLITDDDIQDWRTAEDPGAMSFLVSAAKRQRSEVKLSELSPAEKAEIVAAKEAEVSNWLKTGTVQRMFRNQIPQEQVMRCRWILTWKPID